MSIGKFFYPKVNTKLIGCIYQMATGDGRVQFGDWLLKRMEERGWNLSDLAQKTRVAPAQISRLINGSRGPGPKLCRSLAHALNLPEDVVFRAAGLLSPKPAHEIEAQIDDPLIARIVYILSELDGQDKDEVLALVEAKARNKERRSRIMSLEEQIRSLSQNDQATAENMIAKLLQELGADVRKER